MVIGSASGLAPYRRPDPGGKVQVGGGQPHAADAPDPGDVGGDQGGPQRGQEPFCWYGARLSEWAPDVLVVDDRLDQCDPAS